MEPYYKDEYVTIYHGACEDILPGLDTFDLLLTDPPYGIGAYNKGSMGGGVLAKQSQYESTSWDNAIVNDDLIQQIRGYCLYAIIWGGNYYSLPICRGWFIWDKENGNNKFADGEMAWNNIEGALRICKHQWQGMLRKHNESRQHPTQKPLELMIWCIQQAGDSVNTILDPFAGSGTTGRAAKDLNKHATLIEREEKYCEIAAKRMKQEVLPLYK